MPSNFRVEHVARVPRGWHVRTVTQGDHEVRIAFPRGRRETGSGHVVEILHPKHENPGYCPGRSRMSNPAELVLMGANPSSSRSHAQSVTAREHPSVSSQVESRKTEKIREQQIADARKGSRRVNAGGPRFAIRWHTGNISHAMRSEAEARKLLHQFHGAGEIIRVNPLPLRRRNPVALETEDAEKAREIREGFVDRPTRGYTEIEIGEPHMPAGDYAELGKLFDLVVKPTPTGSTPQIQEMSFHDLPRLPMYVTDAQERAYRAQLEAWYRRASILLVSATTREKLYIVGHYMLTGEEIRRFNSDVDGVVELGECRRIAYVVAKYHAEVGNDAAGKLVQWDHRFGEQSGIVPSLWYDVPNRRLLLRGGDYRVEDAGIVN